MSELVVGSIAGLAANSYVVDVSAGSTLDLSNGAVFPAGNVIQVVSTTKTDSFTSSTNVYADITGLSASITPRSTSSKILAMVNLGTYDQSSAQVLQMRVLRDSTPIGIGDSAGSREQVGSLVIPHQANRGQQVSWQYLDSPSSTASLTYKVQAWSTTGTIYINRAATDTDSALYGRSVSTITLMEIAG